MIVTLRPSYCARYVTLKAVPAFLSGALVVAVDDNGVHHNTATPHFATMAEALAFVADQPGRIWATPNRLERPPFVFRRGSARESYGVAR